ncbi:hypothetical protein BC936DRAFT_141753 [Jimgerdemannia flammicorona]|uniref:Uncharacterized protein n=1 Tax=Jimgerdemannia flammicorona TaxID=994334 RepID=A0A433A1P6_9FUNG|nr:hypothetical protein BC936DRAFT_141753 [Jimgerdemannia flammicorona]
MTGGCAIPASWRNVQGRDKISILEGVIPTFGLTSCKGRPFSRIHFARLFFLQAPWRHIVRFVVGTDLIKTEQIVSGTGGRDIIVVFGLTGLNAVNVLQRRHNGTC